MLLGVESFALVGRESFFSMPPHVEGYSEGAFLQNVYGSFVRDVGAAIAQIRDEPNDKQQHNKLNSLDNGGVASPLEEAAVKEQQLWPPEFVCPISNFVMVDPVIVASGQTYERRCIEAWFQLGQRTCMKQGIFLERFFLIPNVAVKTAIQNLARSKGYILPPPLDPEFAMALAKRFIPSETDSSSEREQKCSSPQDDTAQETQSSDLVIKKPMNQNPRDENSTELSSFGVRLTAKDEKQAAPPTVRLLHSASGQILIETGTGNHGGKDQDFPLTLASKPLSCSAQPHEDRAEEQRNRTIVVDSALVGSLVKKMSQTHSLELEQTATQLRKLSRQNAESRLALCQPDLLSVLQPNLLSRYPGLQINCVAAMVNLSLENENKVKIVRAGIVPTLIDVLKSGHPEAQEHAAGAIFSLALHDENKMAIGVLGAIPPLIHVLRSGTFGARQDAAMALYHLSYAQGNRAKLAKLGAIPILLDLAQENRADLASRVLLILCNIAATSDGRTALLELNAISTLVGLLTPPQIDPSQSSYNVAEIQEHAVSAMHLLSQSIIKFRSLALRAGALEALMNLSEKGTPRARQKASALLAILRETPVDSEFSYSSFSRMFGRKKPAGPVPSDFNSSDF
eukprot:c16857_g1_i2 orf=753-2630(+)